ncbi:myotubularin, putative [Entamoeba histolytica HM-3:IMSS]|uniref:Myotubularin, putative n=2 Tax=Entamoeba histolytica TaxID=5759 RepID=M2Q1E7_ENTHI|nr:myotubularin, putative [Entamoeba histolytica KU27]EMS17728.1 myotubularin, putative [Entamoeba histolytica HM-3:IMSS]
MMIKSAIPMISDKETPPSPLMPFSPTPPTTYDSVVLSPHRCTTTTNTPLAKSIIDFTTINNSYTQSRSPPTPTQQYDGRNTFIGENFKANAKNGYLIITYNYNEKEKRISMINIKDLTNVNGNWKIICKDFQVIPLGRGDGIYNWVFGGLRNWNLRGLLVYQESTSAYDISEYYMHLGCIEEWCVRTFNEGYEICDSYPRQMILPIKVSKEEIKLSASRRYYNRFPALVWYNNEYKNVLMRNSATIKGCYNDTQIPFAFTNKKNLVIMDFVDKITSCKMLLPTMKIREIPCFDRKTLMKYYHQFIEYINQPEVILKQIDNIKWMSTISLMLKQASLIYEYMKNGTSVSINCIDGTGICSILSSLCCILCDDYFRTIKGFIALIEKEWVLMGYPFAQYLGIDNDYFSNEPVEFILFIHCVEAIIRQNPTALEITEDLIIFILDELYKGKCNTFLFNSEKERRRECVDGKTLSLYDLIIQELKLSKFKNYNFDVTSPVSISENLLTIPLWTKYYLRYSFPKIAELNLC